MLKILIAHFTHTQAAVHQTQQDRGRGGKREDDGGPPGEAKAEAETGNWSGRGRKEAGPAEAAEEAGQDPGRVPQDIQYSGTGNGEKFFPVSLKKIVKNLILVYFLHIDCMPNCLKCAFQKKKICFVNFPI